MNVFFPGSNFLSQSLMLRPTVSGPVCLGIKHPSGAYEQIFITVGQLRVCRYGAFSLTRGRVGRLQLLLALASAVILGSLIPWDSRPYFTVSDLRLPFSSSPTTRRVTVEVFNPASTHVLRFISICDHFLTLPLMKNGDR
jgi:hypothetical protein